MRIVEAIKAQIKAQMACSKAKRMVRLSERKVKELRKLRRKVERPGQGWGPWSREIKAAEWTKMYFEREYIQAQKELKERIYGKNS